MDDDPSDDFEDRVQDEVGDYLGDVRPELDPDEPRYQARGGGCLLILALPCLAGLWFLR
jgi:hypothetical protein